MIAAEVNLMPDGSFFPLLGIFLIVVVVLNVCVFRPLVGIIERRRIATEGEREKAKQIEHAADGHDAEVHRELESLRELGTSLRATMRGEAQQSAERLIEDAKKDGLRIIAEGGKRRDTLERDLREELNRNVPDITRHIVRKMMFEDGDSQT